jgi:hypothetical protein
MKRLISTCAIAAVCAVAAHAQDSTSTTRTQVKADDAKAVTATGCLVPGATPGSFALKGAITARGEEVSSKTRVDRENGNDSKTRTEAKITVDRDNGPRLNVISLKSLGASCS